MRYSSSRLRTNLLCVILSANLVSAWGDEEEFDELQRDWREDTREAVEDIDADFKEDVRSIVKDLTREGDLDGALIARSVLKGAQPLNAPRTIEDRMAEWQEARARELGPINERYGRDLEFLSDDVQRDGNLKLLSKIKRELSSLKKSGTYPPAD